MNYTDTTQACSAPFSVSEDYEGRLHLIDSKTRVVLSDNFAYDRSGDARLARMEWIAESLSQGVLSALQERQHSSKSERSE